MTDKILQDSNKCMWTRYFSDEDRGVS